MRRGQASVETIFVISISTMLLIPASYLFYEFLISSSDEIIRNQVGSIGNSFVQNANLVYNYGNYAKISVDYNFPENINNMSIRADVLTITYSSKTDVVSSNFLFGINVSGAFEEEDWQSGEKTYVFQTIKGGDVVSIQRI